ncbi:1,4-alpha-glucan branching enzyme [Streptomyces dubilierae]|uniref:1,4-alpha-glucan branching enzyme GlgB n=1 Tax=Streptomyces dubilierae TaxID=3075533 RepID=A0ABU2P7M8_9ACTN|nr:1,4-alpha-glucan branching enzyme [Streptomyces sp. DSM 41921]MDT0386790.1 1,4-alpha-glucan branching enzyme [Streptomyces sp. DSM 41921]
MTPRPESSGPRPQGTAGEKIPEQPTAAQKKSAAKKTAVPKQAAAKKGTAAAKKAAARKTAAPAKTTTKKAVAKKAAAETPVEGTAAKKATARKATTTKAATGRTGATKAAAAKATTTKATASKATATKAAAAKASTTKAAAAKASTTKAAAAKAATTKAAAGKASTTKAAAGKASATKAAAAKTTTAKAAASKATTTKAAAVKTTATKAAATKTTTTKAAAAKTTAAKAVGKASAAKAVAEKSSAVSGGKKAVAKKGVAKKAPAGKATVAEGAPVQAVPPEMEIAVSPAVDAGDRERLLSGTHHDPHSVLGAHPVPGGIAFRAFRPYALSVTVVAGEVRAELHADGEGFFSGLLPLREVPEYRLLVQYEGTLLDTEDAYRFLPTLGDLDLHLIGEGRHEELWTALGAHPMTHQGVTGTRFAVWAPNARGVRVAGTFNFWDGTGHAMRSLGSSGVWELFLPDVGEGELYKFEITRSDGSKTMRADPMARRTEVPPATSSVITSSRYEWGDAEWLARRAEAPAHEAPFSVYEIHLPSWRPGLTYRQLAEQLPGYVKNLGFTHVELMPVAEHPFGGSWGYQVTGFYAPTARLGTPDDFRYLVDKLHQAGIGVIMDWVPAHFPRDDWALAEFDGRPLYEHADPLRAAHPDWGTLEFDFGRNEVRNFLVANAVYWCEEFHIDGLRVDAVASMLYLDYSREPGQWTPNEHGGRENLDAVAFLQEMNATVYRRVPGVVTVAEESTAWDGVTRATHHKGPSGFGGLGFGLKWNMGWMHDSLQYMSHEPVHRKYHHHEMTFSMVYAYSENYVLPISHDEVVHGKGSLVSKMPGDWWQQRAGVRSYLGYMWAHPGKQLLFMGQEFAQGAEWSEAHGPDWWLLDPGYGAEADHRGVRDLVRDLNTVYRATPALWRLDTDPAGFEWIAGDAADDNVLAFLRLDPEGNPLLAVSNFAPVVRPDYRLGVPEDVPAWHEAVNTDAARYGGSDVTNPDPVKPEAQPWHGRPASIRLTLPPLATVWLRPA